MYAIHFIETTSVSLRVKQQDKSKSTHLCVLYIQAMVVVKVYVHRRDTTEFNPFYYNWFVWTLN